jgi:hypothetical protein
VFFIESLRLILVAIKKIVRIDRESRVALRLAMLRRIRQPSL